MSYMEALTRALETILTPAGRLLTEARNEQYRREFAARIHALSGG